eukprot:4205779-Heterocapsa_arctica.AAC.1
MATQAVVWDGTEQPCRCGAFKFLHKHQKGKTLSDTLQCSSEDTETYWEQIADAASEQEKKDEEKAAADTKRAREEVWDLGKARDICEAAAVKSQAALNE